MSPTGHLVVFGPCILECIGLLVTGAREPRSHSDRLSCGLECLNASNALNVYSFQMQFGLPGV